MFDELKAAQVAAFFLFKARGQIYVLKLMKLMYLAERASFEEFGEPMIGDRLVSMPHGPVLSQTLNLASGFVRSQPDGWNTWMEDREEHRVRLLKHVEDPRHDLRRLSDSELRLLETVWSQFGSMGKYQLRDWTHDHCPEWEDPNGASMPITYERLLLVLGYSAEDSRELVDRLEDCKHFRDAISRVAAEA